MTQDLNSPGEVTQHAGEIPGVISVAKSRTNWPLISGLMICLCLVVIGLAFGGKHLLARLKPAPKNDIGAMATAASANTAGATRSFPTEAPPLARTSLTTNPDQPSAPQFPAIDANHAPQPVQPIPLATAGGNAAPRAASQTRAPLTAEDGPVLLTQPLRNAPGSTLESRSEASSSIGLPNSTPRTQMTRAGESDARNRAAQVQTQMMGLVDRLVTAQQGGGAQSAGLSAALAPAQQQATARPSLFGGQMQSSEAPTTYAKMLANPSLTLTKGTTFNCALKTKVVSATSGFISCTVLRNVFSHDGQTVLIERGSHLDGEYRITTVKPGVTRIPTIWSRMRTSNGVIADLESPAVGALGESGLGGYVDNRWGERVGAALLVGFLDDLFQAAVNSTVNQDDTNNTVVLTSTQQQAQKLPEKILESTINIPPIITQNQGAMVGIYVARDIDFSTVYALRNTGLR